MDPTWLELAKQAYHTGDHARARELLTGYVRMQEHDAEGWYWFARCIENRSARIQYYQKALALQPDHSAARTELASLLSVPVATPVGGGVDFAQGPTTRPERLNAGALGQLPSSRPFSASRLASTTFFGLSLLLAIMVSLAVVPMVLGLRSFVIMSGSMEPTISTGSIAITRSVPAPSLRVGDVIAFSPHADSVMPTIHRIIKIEDRQGDSLLHDPRRCQHGR